MFAFAVIHEETEATGSVVSNPHFDQSGAWVVVMWDDNTFSCEPVNNLLAQIIHPSTPAVKSGPPKGGLSVVDFPGGKDDKEEPEPEPA